MELLDFGLMALIAATVDVTMVTILWHFYIKKYNLHPFIRFAKQYAGILGAKGGASKRDVKLRAKNTVTETKLLDGLIAQIPMGGAIKAIMEKQGLSGLDVFDALQDENFVKGVKVLYSAFGGIVGKFQGKPAEETSSLDNYQ
jgi:hypothetical protein